jgi:hypothetical protein
MRLFSLSIILFSLNVVVLLINRCRFIRLPHKDGKELRVGNPLSKSFFGKVHEGILTTESGHHAQKVLRAGKMLSYWKSNRVGNSWNVSI